MEYLDGLEEFLRAISDGKSWNIVELAKRLGWNEYRVARYCELVSEHELVHYNRNDHSVRIDPGLRKLILQLDSMATSFP